MAWRDSHRRWGGVSQLFHWLTALLVLGLLVAGFAAAEFITDIGTRFRIIQWHKSFGLLVLALTALRLGWRWFSPGPAAPGDLKPYERALARLSHAGLYTLLIAMPLAGWLSVSTATRGIPTEVFGLFTLPRLLAPNAGHHRFFETAHAVFAYLLVALLLLHVAAALHHHWRRKDDVLRRMLPNKMK
ncbi:MAG: cytochrome b [Pseudomonadota bacterium]|jgi:cytochrome b561